MASDPPATASDLLAYFAELEIETATVDHEAVYTVEEARRLRGSLPGSHSKSLFLRNKKKQMWLVTTDADRQIDLKRLGEVLGAGRVGFGSPERLMTYLGVIPGAVTPFAVINDTARVVRVALDREMLDDEPLNFHPLVNTKTTTISRGDLLRFLDATDHRPVLLEPEDF
jgi:Ala-tRNA(Pro) deacylase